MSSSDSDLESNKAGLSEMIPSKSKVKYLQAYDTFMNWKKQNQKHSLDENVFLDYFTELSDKRKPSSLWAIYSMLKCTVRIKHNVYIQNYANLNWFLKKMSRGYKGVVTKVLTEENIKKFIQDAPDEIYLGTKVALILGVSGACRSGELVKLTTKSIKKHGAVFVVTVRDSQHDTDRVFIIREELAPLVEKYQALRPKNVETERFFLKYRDGKCIRQVVGTHKISSMPKDIATFLQLPNPKSYTGHCFRKSAKEYSGVVLGSKRKEKKFGTNPEDIMDSTVVAEMQKRKVDETDENGKNEKNDTIAAREEIAHDSAQEIEVVIEDNKNSTINSLRNVRVSHALPPGTFSDSEMEFDKDSDDMSEDPIHIKSEIVDETINMSPQPDWRVTPQPSVSKEKVHVSTDENRTNIRIAGKNINIIFKNCSNVGNVTINIIKD